MAAFSAHQDDQTSRIAGAPEPASFEETPTVVSSNPLALEADVEGSATPEDSLPNVEIAADQLPPSRELGSTEAYGLAEATPSGSEGDSGEAPAPVTEQRTVISKRPPIADLYFPQPFTPHELGQALVGKQLAHFQLEEFLGGGMGAVFRGRDLTLGRSVAVKVLPRGQDEDTLRRFKNEAQSAARLNHENIARVYYIGEEDGWNFIIFEHIEGPTIRQLVAERGPLPLDEAIHHTLQAAEALDHAFRRDVVHRDIKPSNLIVSSEGSTKLVDMGLARLHQVEASKNDLTASGVTLGTFDYISPEQARDPRSADVRSDLYSLGCTLYFMLTGRPPFPDGTVLQKLLDHQSRQPADLRVFRPDLPEPAVALVNRLLSKQPEDRYQTPRELIAALAALAEQLDLPTRSPHGVALAPPPRRRLLDHHLTWLAPTLLLIGAVFIGEWRARTQEPDDFVFPPIQAPGEASTAQVQAARESGNASTDSDTAATDSLSGRSLEPHGGETGGTSDMATGRNSSATEILDADLTRTATARAERSPNSRSPGSRSTATDGASPTAGNRHSPAIPPRDAPNVSSPRAISSEPPPSHLVRTVIVGGSKVAVPEDADWFETADEAFRQASLNKWPDLEVIELRFTGPQEVRPFRLAGPHVTIRAAEDYAPVLGFRTPVGSIPDKHMIQVQGGNLSLEGVQIRWSLPVDLTPRDWAMFLLDDARQLSLRECVLTLENDYADGSAQENGAAFIRLASSTINQRAMLQPAEPPITPEIYLSECIVRGEADFVAADAVEPFELTWEQGLLATSEHFAEMGGAGLPRIGGIRIALDHVTVDAEEGFCRLASSNTTPHRLPLALDTHNCLFVTGPTAPLVEHEVLSDELRSLKSPQAEWGNLLNWTGFNNVRMEGKPAWRVEDEANGMSMEIEPLSAAWATIGGGAAFVEKRLAWSRPRMWSPKVHERSVQSYAVEFAQSTDVENEETPGLSLGVLPEIQPESLPN
jgi:serine/threonine-protein kinase